MSKVGSHDPFGHLKHKLWLKERSRVKLTIWLPTTKRRESTWFPCDQVACNIPLKSYWQGLQLCFRSHLNRRSAHKVIGPQSRGSPNIGNLGVLRQNVIWMWALWRGTKYTIRGKVVASPKSGPWWVLWIWVCLWLDLAPKVFLQSINQLLVWFCAGPCEWISACHFS
jgi:hypothetical protein